MQRRRIERACLRPVERDIEAGSSARDWRRSNSARHRAGHLARDRHPGSESGAHSAHPAGVLGRVADRLGSLILRVLAQVTQHAHLRALVQRLLHFRRQRDVFDVEQRQRQPHRLQVRSDMFQRELT